MTELSCRRSSRKSDVCLILFEARPSATSEGVDNFVGFDGIFNWIPSVCHSLDGGELMSRLRRPAWGDVPAHVFSLPNRSTSMSGQLHAKASGHQTVLMGTLFLDALLMILYPPEDATRHGQGLDTCTLCSITHERTHEHLGGTPTEQLYLCVDSC